MTGVRTPHPRQRTGIGGGRAEGIAPSRPRHAAARRAGAARAPLEMKAVVRTRDLRYGLRRALWARLQPGSHAVATCGRYPAPGTGVMVRRAGDRTTHYAGLVTCGSISGCPCCSAKIRAERRDEIEAAVRVHTERGGGALFVTLTLPHTRAQGLIEVWDLLARAFDGVIRGRHRQALRDEFGVVGFIRCTEVTHGRHGWHPHVHILMLVDRPWDDLGRVADLWRWIHTRWARRVVALGGKAPSLARGVQVIPCWSEVTALSQYLAAVSGDISTEMAGPDTKGARLPGSRSPFTLLHDAVEHDDAAAWDLYTEWLVGAKGRRLIAWSRGLREHLGLHERADEEIARDRDPAEVVAYLTRDAWRAMLGTRCTLEALTAAEAGGAHGMTTALRGWGINAWLDQVRDGPPVIRVRRPTRTGWADL